MGIFNLSCFILFYTIGLCENEAVQRRTASILLDVCPLAAPQHRRGGHQGVLSRSRGGSYISLCSLGGIYDVTLKLDIFVTQAALKLGLSHVPLANAALDALETWSSHIPPEIMQPCYKLILPLLDGYLKTSGNDSKPLKANPSNSHCIETWKQWPDADDDGRVNRLLVWLLDKEDSVWEVMSSLSSRTDIGYSRVMTRLLKKSNQLAVVT